MFARQTLQVRNALKPSAFQRLLALQRYRESTHTPEENKLYLEYAEQSKRTSLIFLHGGPAPHPSEVNSLSPTPAYCTLATFLSYYDLKYEAKIGMLFSKEHNKVPWISYKGKQYSDSQLIINMLCNENDIDINHGLTDMQKTISFAFETSIKDKLYWIDMYRRYLDDNVQHYLSGFCPTPPQVAIDYVRDLIRAQLYAQGTGRFSDDEVYSMYKQHVNGILILLDNKPFMFGNDNNLTYLDFVVYGALSSMYAYGDYKWGKFENKLVFEDEIRCYLDRVEEKVWGKIGGWKESN